MMSILPRYISGYSGIWVCFCKFLIFISDVLRPISGSSIQFLVKQCGQNFTTYSWSVLSQWISEGFVTLATLSLVSVLVKVSKLYCRLSWANQLGGY